jgi:hypothetical protein
MAAKEEEGVSKGENMKYRQRLFLFLVQTTNVSKLHQLGIVTFERIFA